jgi:CMP-N,N'-diacetyllegionaminic acid synthase
MSLSILCTICARAGSKGVQNKNLKVIAGLPLIAHSIKQALESGLFSGVAVSSDSEEILQVAQKYGAQHLIHRPVVMATDEAPKLPAIQHCVSEVEKLTQKKFDLIVDLDCTSPLRNVDDIDQCIRQLSSSAQATNLITGFPSRRSPYFNMVVTDSQGYARLAIKPESAIVRRQDAPQCYDMNASIYVWRREALFNLEKVISDRTLFYEMPEERSIDIDSPLDFEFVKFMMEKI